MPERQDVDDIQLIKEAQSGSSEAFGLLYERYAQVIFRFLYAHLSDRLDAEDLTEEVFLRVWRTLPKYREQGIPFVAYLFRVARNALIDQYRRSKAPENNLPLEENTIADTLHNPAEVVIQGMEKQEIRELLGLLREEYRTVLLLRFMGDLSPDETADVMGKSAGAVRVLQHRALGALRKLLDS